MKPIITTRWNVDNEDHQEVNLIIQTAATWLRDGDVIAFPTETVYGLGANACSNEAIEKIFQAKGRPSDNPLIVHIANLEQLSQVASSWSKTAERLMEAFWPGPLTIVLPKANTIAERTTAGLSSIGIRMPNHPIALAFIAATGLPIAAPSANTSGKPSPTIGDHVYQDLNGKIKGIIDAGATGVGLESTVVEVIGENVTILRPGGITKPQLETVVSHVIWDPALIKSKETPKSPGMKYSHYAPNAPLYLIKGDKAFFQSTIVQFQEQGKKVGVLASDELVHMLYADEKRNLGSSHNLAQLAQKLYFQLRSFDKTNVEVILAEMHPSDGLGDAIMNRLQKAAGNRIISSSKST